MSNVATLKKFKVIARNTKLKKAQEDAINALSSAEVKVLIKVRKRVPKLVGMKFKPSGAGIF